MMAALYEAKKRGATVLAINPLRERGFTDFSDPKNVGELVRDRGIAVADAIYQVQIGGDLAALKGVMKALLEMERAAPGTVFDHAFIAAHTEGFDALIADLDACAWDDLVARSGLAEAQMREIAAHYAARERHDDHLVHGPDPSSRGRRHHPAGGQPAAAARQHRPPRCGRDAGARAFQRAGRPHHGRDLDGDDGVARQPRSAPSPACGCAAMPGAMRPA